MTPDRPILVLDFHTAPPRFAGPQWFPAGASHVMRKVVTDGELPEQPDAWSHIILSGSAHSIVDDHDFVPPCEEFLRAAWEAEVPMMGVCYGSQLIARAILGRDHVRHNPLGIEVGWLPVEVVDESGDWFDGLPRPFHTWHSHIDEVCNLPSDWRVLARSGGCAVQAWDVPGRQVFGVQFHPEMDLEAGNAAFVNDATMLAEHSVDANELTRNVQDDEARCLFTKFLQPRS